MIDDISFCSYFMMKYKSFTLIELLIVIVIIGILAVALVPRFTGSQSKARDTARKSHIRQLQQALMLYASENGGYPALGVSCIGSNSGEKCRPGFLHNDGVTTGVGMGNLTLNTILRDYLTSIPVDPLSTRSVGEKYLYWKGNLTAIHCNAFEYVDGKSWLAWQPDQDLGPTNTAMRNDKSCVPGKVACCSSVGCGSHYFCVLQLDE